MEVTAMPTPALALAALSGSTVDKSVNSGGSSNFSSNAALESAAKFIAASHNPSGFPARHFCVVCGAFGRYAYPGSLDYICSIKCKTARAAM